MNNRNNDRKRTSARRDERPPRKPRIKRYNKNGIEIQGGDRPPRIYGKDRGDVE